MSLTYIKDLSDDQLILLYGEINVNSIYYSDCRNSFGIDEVELYDIANYFVNWISLDDNAMPVKEEDIDYSPENFVYFIKNIY